MKRLPEISQVKEQRKLNRVTRISGIAGTVIFGSLLGCFIFFGKKFDYCDHALEIQFHDVVTEKFHQAWDRNYHGLKITNDEGEFISLNLTHDLNFGKNGRSILWENVSTGDSIVKKPGELVVRFKKIDEDWKEKNIKFDPNQRKNED